MMNWDRKLLLWSNLTNIAAYNIIMKGSTCTVIRRWTSCTAIRRWTSCTVVRRWDTRSVVLLQNHCTVVRKWRTYTLVRRQSAGAVIQWWRACQIELVITFIRGVYKCNLRDVEVTNCDMCPEFVSWAITAAVIVLITFSKFAEAPARQSTIKTTLQM